MLQVSDNDPLQPGVVVGKRFKLERLLGRGAVGSVWLATHVALSSPVAIKFLDRAKVIDPDEMDMRLDRFRFEAQISARLAVRTNHTVAVQDAGVFQDIPYLVMEYAPGRTLEDLLAHRGALSPAEVALFVEQIAEALDSSHALGLIHRDVKLANVMSVERDDNRPFFKLADFGVARTAGDKSIGVKSPRKTADGLIVGTPAYMSPEQIGGAEGYGKSVDVWALAVMMYECLTGQLPFMSSSLTALAMEISGRPHTPPSKLVPSLPPALDTFFDKALAKLPDARFASAGDLSAAYRRAIEASGEHNIALPPTPKRGVGWLPVLAGAAAIAAFVVVFFTIGRRPSAGASTEPSSTPVVPEESRQSQPPVIATESSTIAVTPVPKEPTSTPSGAVSPKRPLQATSSAASVVEPPPVVPKNPRGKVDPSQVW